MAKSLQENEIDSNHQDIEDPTQNKIKLHNFRKWDIEIKTGCYIKMENYTFIHLVLHADIHAYFTCYTICSVMAELLSHHLSYSQTSLFQFNSHTCIKPQYHCKYFFKKNQIVINFVLSVDLCDLL